MFNNSNTADNKNNEDSTQIKDYGSITTTDGKHVIHCLTIIGQIEGHYILPNDNKSTKYEHIIPQIVAVEQSAEIEGLLIVLNTCGGDVEAGLALAELISGISKPTVSLVLGGGHSIGVPLAVSTDYSYIAPTATMTIHPVRTNGLVIGVPQTLINFERMQNRITEFVVNNSGVDREEFRQLMMNTEELTTDIGTTVDGNEAVRIGLINSVGNLSDALKKLYEFIDKGSEE